jgi:hypothetical protein
MKRPLGITIIAVLLGVGAVLALVTGVGAIANGLVLPGLLILVLSGAYLYLVWGLWHLKPWAWLATIIVQGLRLLIDIISVISGTAFSTNYTAIVLGIIIIVYLLADKNVRAAFNR